MVTDTISDLHLMRFLLFRGLHLTPVSVLCSTEYFGCCYAKCCTRLRRPMTWYVFRSTPRSDIKSRKSADTQHSQSLLHFVSELPLALFYFSLQLYLRLSNIQSRNLSPFLARALRNSQLKISIMLTRARIRRRVLPQHRTDDVFRQCLQFYYLIPHWDKVFGENNSHCGYETKHYHHWEN
jgi:hypothetical protein